MKKNFKQIFTLLLGIVFGFSAIANVAAETIPNTFSASYSANWNVPIKYGPEGLYNHIKTSTGRYAYCVHYELAAPTGIGYTKGELVTDNGMNYILKKSYNASNDSEHLIYKSALWMYMLEKGLIPGNVSLVRQYSNNVNADNSATATQIKNIIAEAKKAGANDTSNPTITVNTNGVNFTLDSDKKYYVSNEITVSSSTGSFRETLTSAPEGTTITKNGNKLVVKVPADKVGYTETKIEFKVNNSKDIYTSYRYNPSSNAYQPIVVPFKETKSAEAKGTVSLAKKTGGVSISKQDITNKEELPGATLVVKDYDGNVIEKWVSTNKPHIINQLKPGIYTLTETIAPEGYILSSETITFTVKEDGTITTVVMYNTPDKKEETPKQETPKQEVQVENTASFKTVTSSLLGTIIIIAGGYIIFKNSKKEKIN